MAADSMVLGALFPLQTSEAALLLCTRGVSAKRPTNPDRVKTGDNRQRAGEKKGARSRGFFGPFCRFRSPRPVGLDCWSVNESMGIYHVFTVVVPPGRDGHRKDKRERRVAYCCWLFPSTTEQVKLSRLYSRTGAEPSLLERSHRHPSRLFTRRWPCSVKTSNAYLLLHQ